MLGCQTNRVSQTKVQECKYSEFSNIGTAFHVYRTNSWYIGAVFSLPRWIPGNILSFLQEKKNVKLTLFADDITCSIKNSKFLRKSIFGTVRAVGQCWWLEHRLFQSLRILIVKEADSIFYIFIWNGKDKVKPMQLSKYFRSWEWWLEYARYWIYNSHKAKHMLIKIFRGYITKVQGKVFLG